jgi:hypothetical protein
MSHSSPSALGYKVNRRQARQGELRSKRGSSGGEGALGHSLSSQGMSAIGHSVRQGPVRVPLGLRWNDADNSLIPLPTARETPR